MAADGKQYDPMKGIIWEVCRKHWKHLPWFEKREWTWILQSSWWEFLNEGII